MWFRATDLNGSFASRNNVYLCRERSENVKKIFPNAKQYLPDWGTPWSGLDQGCTASCSKATRDRWCAIHSSGSINAF